MSSGLAVSAEGRLSDMTGEKSAYLRKQALDELVRELQDQAWVLDGLADKLLREHLFHLSGRLLGELTRVQAVGREAALDEAGREAFKSRPSKDAASWLPACRSSADSIRAKVPTLFHPNAVGAGQGPFAADCQSGAETLQHTEDHRFGSSSRRSWRSLSLTVEALAQNLEGAYAQSVNRLSVTFRAASGRVSGIRFRKCRRVRRSFVAGLEGLLTDLAAETQQYFRRSGAMGAVQRLAQDIKDLAKAARKIRSEVFVPVDPTPGCAVHGGAEASLRGSGVASAGRGLDAGGRTGSSGLRPWTFRCRFPSTIAGKQAKLSRAGGNKRRWFNSRDNWRTWKGASRCFAPEREALHLAGSREAPGPFPSRWMLCWARVSVCATV